MFPQFLMSGHAGDSLKNLMDAAVPVLPQFDKESLQSLQNFIEQIPLVLDQVLTMTIPIIYCFLAVCKRKKDMGLV